MKKILLLCPGFVYLAWYIANVRSIAARHLDQEIVYPFLICGFSVMSLLFFMFSIYTHKRPGNDLFIPLIYMTIGILTLMVGYNTPCCSGG